VNADLVLIPVTVTDKRGRIILGLTKAQFQVFEDGVEQAVTHFSSEDIPISLGIVFDISGSIGAKLRRSREALSEILRGANPADEFALVQCDGRAQLVVEPTSDIGEIRERLLFAESKGRTALLDAIYLAVNIMRTGRYSRRAVVVISDGGDNHSRYRVGEVRSLVRESDVQVFALGVFEPYGGHERTPEEMTGPDLLSDIANETGGHMFAIEKYERLRNAAAQIRNMLRNQYVLGFQPKLVHDGRYHRVRVKLRGVEGVRLFWRLGYYSPGR
jgi:VWFA-related protein